MEKKQVIRRAALAGGVVFVVALVLAMILGGIKHSHRNDEARRVEAEAAALRKEYQEYLDETARNLKGLPADPRVVGEIQARHYRGLPTTSMYVWATTNEGEFSFGIPTDAFARLNAAWDHHHALIVRDNYYASRDQFLRNLLHQQRTIPLRPPKDEDDSHKGYDEDDWWRLQRENTDARWNGGSIVLLLSSPIADGDGRTVGNLNLKLVQPHAERRFPFWNGAEDLLAVLAGFSVIWLWFLLPSWVFVDAQERGMPRPLLWAFLVLVGNLFALCVYLISRPPASAPKELRCPRCQRPLNGAKAGCPYCGADLSAAFCAQCQYPLKSDWGFCPACRTPAGKTAAAEAPAPPTP